MATPRILICGASIAGPALAHWLDRYGWETVVVERAPALRTGGQNVDIRGAAREVVRRTGLEEAIRAATTGELGTRFVDAGGGVVAEFPAGTGDTDGATAELEVLRGDLAQLLVEASSGTEYVFGDRVTGLREEGSGVEVTFAHAAPRSFDLVVAADGMRSTTRDVGLGASAATIRPLGLSIAYFTIPRTGDDEPWWYWYSAPGGRSVTLRPDAHGTTRAALTFLSDDSPARRPTAAEQQQLLRETFADAGWQTRRVLDAMGDAPDFSFESIGQVRAPRWSHGRFVLAGDAAHCASPVSGMGTSLALVGAYVLAGELAAHVHHQDALAGYERIMRPYAERAQKLPPGVPRVANPRSRAGIAAFHTALRLAASRPARRLGAVLSSPPAGAVDLPDYSHLAR